MGRAHKHKTGGQAVENRELSWLRFNRRVQEEADDPANPLLERAKFLAIVTSNLDEFLQVRYHGLYAAARADAKRMAQGDIAAAKLYRRVNKEILRQNNRQYQLFEGIRSELYLKGVKLYPTFSMNEEQLRREKELFEKEIRPYLKVEPLLGSRPRQKQLYLCVKLQKSRRKEDRFRLVPLPSALPRLMDLSTDTATQCLIRVEEIVRHHVQRLFSREQVEHVAVMRVIRNQDFPVEERGEEDIVPAVREMLSRRTTGRVMRLEAEERMSEEMLTRLMKEFDVDLPRRYRVTGPLDLNKLMMTLYGQVKRAELKFSAARPVDTPELMGPDIFEAVDRRDWLLYHPYHSFAPVVNLMQRAAEDPSVSVIKQTLYRVSGNSPIVAALARAAEAGKQVTVLFEAHARFDEENNLYWGERLSRAGCRVLYGLPGLKVHSKITYIRRQTAQGARCTLHLGTGNYHDGTARLYTDFGLLTADETLARDAEAFFGALEGGTEAAMQSLVSAPNQLSTELRRLIARERAHAEAMRPAGILAKMNSLSDEPLMRELVEASQAGVQVRLLVRGICCLIPGVLGVSDNIQVRSIVGRHLEHARAFVFENGGNREVYLASADWMPRNLYKRVELMFPVRQSELAAAVVNVLQLQWADTQKCRRRDASGAYTLAALKTGGVNAQEILLQDIAAAFAGRCPGCATEGDPDERLENPDQRGSAGSPGP